MFFPFSGFFLDGPSQFVQICLKSKIRNVLFCQLQVIMCHYDGQRPAIKVRMERSVMSIPLKADVEQWIEYDLAGRVNP